MTIPVKTISDAALAELLNMEESHFVDLKSREISPSKLTKTVSAFCNSSGGEIYVGVGEFAGAAGKQREWDGFADQEAANAVIQVLEEARPLSSHYSAEFMACSSVPGLVLHLTIFKTQEILKASDGKVYVRRSAQSLPIKEDNEDALERLRYDKGVKTFEDELLSVPPAEITNSERVIEFLLDVIPTGEPQDWLTKQQVLVGDRPTVAGVMLFSDMPQAILPKRSAVKILRYQTKTEAERDFLAFDPLTIEGPIYSLIYDSVEATKKIIEGIERVGPTGMEKISYPEEALHEILTNAVLHRDYSVAADVQIRIFDNRVEIESPGRLPGHVTVKNIVKTQFARNPKIVRLINKFKNPPNKDVGEGLNTAFEAMDKLRLKKPLIEEHDGSVIVILRHEGLGSPEQLVLEYLTKNPKITNSIARDLTGIKSENAMKDVFIRLRDRSILEPVPGLAGNKAAWQKKDAAGIPTPPVAANDDAGGK